MTACVCQKRMKGHYLREFTFHPLFLLRVCPSSRDLFFAVAERSSFRTCIFNLRLVKTKTDKRSSKHEQHRTQSISGHRSPCPYNFAEVTKCSFCQFALGNASYIPHFNGPHDEPTICFNWWTPSGEHQQPMVLFHYAIRTHLQIHVGFGQQWR